MEKVINILKLVLGAATVLIAYFFKEKAAIWVGGITVLMILILVTGSFVKNVAGNNKLKNQRNDALLFLSAFIATDWTRDELMGTRDNWLYVLMAMETVVMIYSIRKFKQVPGDHAISSKLYAIATMLWLCAMNLMNNDYGVFPLLCILGLLSFTESLLIVYFLPVWDERCNTLLKALQKRKEYNKYLGIK